MKIQNTIANILILSLVGCATENSSNISGNSNALSNVNCKNVINQPYTNVSVEPDIFFVDAEKDSLYKFSKGGYVYVPAHAFLHVTGEPVLGEVELSVEVYTSLGEVMLSGIPMKYDSAGAEYDFTSAGMYTVSGKQNNREVVIAPQKSLEIGITSPIEDSPCFNFYELKESGEWNYLSTQEATLNPDFPIDLVIPEMPEISKEDDLVFDLNIQKMSKFDNSELQNFLWQYDGTRMDTIDKEILSNIHYNNLQLEKTTKSQWSYNLLLSKNNKIVTIPVKPAFTTDNIEVAMQKYQNELAIVQANQAAQSAINQGRYLRISKIQNFGIYNYDRVISDPNRKVISATFDVGKEYSNDFISVYLICKEENFVIRYESYSFSKFSYNALNNNILVATLPNNEVAFIDAETFRKQTSQLQSQKIHFKMNLLDKLVTSSKSLDELIKSL